MNTSTSTSTSPTVNRSGSNNQEEAMGHPLLRDAFASPESRSARVVVVVDVIDSTAMKEKQPQAAWLNSLGFLYDTVTQIATASDPDVVVKYVGDGIMLVFPIHRATEAVNAAIRIQEAITEAGKASGGRVIDFTCSIGVSTGLVVGFTTPSGSPDLVGSVVDKAFRLCSDASGGSIRVDTHTVGAANMLGISSVVGSALDRTPDEYQGDVQKSLLKGFSEPVSCHEIFWDRQLYGVKSAAVTASAERLQLVPKSGPRSEPPPIRTAERAPARTSERHRARVTYWNREKNCGFARDDSTGEDFHFTTRLMAFPDDDAPELCVGTEVAFAAGLAATGDPKKKRESWALLVVGKPAEGRLVSLPEGRNYGWIRVDDEVGNTQLVWVSTAHLTGIRCGDEVEFIVRANDKGAYAEDVERLDDEAA